MFRFWHRTQNFATALKLFNVLQSLLLRFCLYLSISNMNCRLSPGLATALYLFTCRIGLWRLQELIAAHHVVAPAAA